MGAIVILFIPFYLWEGNPCFDFFIYHKDRYLKLESTYSSILIIFHFIGLPVKMTYGFGAYNLESFLTPLCLKISTIMVIVVFLGIAFILIKSIRFFFSKDENNSIDLDKSTKLAQIIAHPFLYFTIAMLLGSICVSKVFSPQYLLWVVPMFSLIHFRMKEIKVAAALFLFACLFTTFIFPYLYFSEFVRGRTESPAGMLVLEAPSILATNILFVRNMLLIGSTITILFFALPRGLRYNVNG